MRANGWKLFFAALLAIVGSAAAAGAEEAAAAGAEEAAPPSKLISKPVQSFPWFVGVGAGAGYAMISRPDVIDAGTAVSVLTLHGGYTFGERLSVGVEVSGSETNVGRDTPKEPFKIGYKPQAIWQIIRCDTCEPRPHGGEVLFTSLVYSSLGARVEYTPFGRDGLFVSGMAGLGFQVGLGDDVGFGFGARVGYRYRATNIMTFSVEAGMTGQLHEDSTMYMPFGVVVLRPYFLSGIRPYPKRRKPPQ